jgi:DNA-binding response OmpR family regulator
MKILVADSDPECIASIGMCCSTRWPHRELLSSDDPEEVVILVERAAPDVVVLEAGLSNGLGYSICREIRSFSSVPLIITTTSEEESEIIKAVELGADDFVSKPFKPLELLARIIAVVRRAQGLSLLNNTRPLISGDLYIDFDNYEVILNGREVRLTFIEFEILRCLVLNKGKAISPAAITELIWGEDADGSRKALKVHIQHLRQKLGETASNPRHILCQRGVGYRFIQWEGPQEGNSSSISRLSRSSGVSLVRG